MMDKKEKENINLGLGMSGRRSSGGGQSSLGYLFGDSDDQSTAAVTQYSTTSGRGQSSLGYLFGSAEQSKHESKSKMSSSPPVCVPPYGTDQSSPEKPLATAFKKADDNPSPKTYIYHKVDSQNPRDFLMMGRPSTRVTSVPGGDSSIGYLFGDK